jgi:hypothetical protein
MAKDLNLLAMQDRERKDRRRALRQFRALLIRPPGAWPRKLRCLKCHEPRWAAYPGDRYHDDCRALASRLDDGRPEAALWS